MSKLNAPGSAPDPVNVEHVARANLSLEDDLSEPVPPFYLPILRTFLTEQPGDTNFLVELNPGSGFGTVTCMEDQCWSDTVLSPDPSAPGGGRDRGLGSLYEYTLHCAGEEHIKCRDKRLAKMDIVIPPRTQGRSVVLPVDIVSESERSQPPSSDRGSESSSSNQHSVSRFASLPSVPSHRHQNSNNSALSRYHSSPLTARNPNTLSLLQTGRKGKGKEVISLLSDSDSDDDDITFVGRNTKLFSRPVTQATAPSWATQWATLPIITRREVAATEIAGLNFAMKIAASPPEKRAIPRRILELNLIKTSPMRPWTQPEKIVMRCLNVVRDFGSWKPHPSMKSAYGDPNGNSTAGTQDVKPSRGALGIPRAPVVPSAPVAGPSTLHVPGAFPAPPNDQEARRNQVWNSIAIGERLTHMIQEVDFLVEVERGLASSAMSPRLMSTVAMVKDRLSELRTSLFTCNKSWTSPNIMILRLFSGIRSRVHPLMVPFLADMASPVDEDDYHGIEYGRPQGKDLQTFLQDSLVDFQEDEDVEAGLKTLKLGSMKEKIPGATFNLMPHQVLGVAFMVKREEREEGSRGGFLMDAMGLGKTVQCISLMLMRNERPSDFERCPQLVVAPLALLAQWKSEIESKTTKNWRVLIHHGTGRPKTVAALKHWDIVLTTYGTLMSESGLPSKNERKKRRDIGDGSDDNEVVTVRKRGPLFSTKWFRVILDEGHLIRNKSTRTSKAAMELDCLHPWVLSGTPIVNSLADLGPGLSFIGHMELKEFSSRVSSHETKKPRMAAKRCQVILRPLMIRRTKDTELNGKKILDLLPKVTNLASLTFEHEERAIYAALEQRARIRVNKFIERGTLMKNYSIVLQLLTRLRQCVNHPWLLRRKPGDTAQPDDLVVGGGDMLGSGTSDFRENDASEYGRAVSIVGPAVVETMVKKLKDRHESVLNEDDGPLDMDCAICYEPFDGSEIITPCAHLYCKGCVSVLFTEPMRCEAALTDEQIQLGCRSCPMCRELIWPGKVFRSAAIFSPPVDEKPDVEDEMDVKFDKGKKRATPTGDEERDCKKPNVGKGKGKGKAVDEPIEVDGAAGTEPSAILPSTKMRHLLELVKGYLADDPNDKILIFSQFVEFLDLLRDFLKLNNIESIGYRGSMSQPQRDEAIRRFNISSEIADNVPVMLISTKAGGVGLNLVMASKVIMCELAWNPATENQAVDRAHRIGQTRQVNVERLVIANSVEDRLLEIQERKGLLADGAMGEGDIGRLGRLTIDDIRNLFAIDRPYLHEDE